MRTQLVNYLLLIGSVSIIAAQNITAQSNVTTSTTTTTTTSTTPTPSTSATTLSAASITTTPKPSTIGQQLSSSTTTAAPATATSEQPLAHNNASQVVSTVTPIPVKSDPSTSVTPGLDIELVKKSIQERIDLNHGENRLAVNRPQSSPPMSEFAPDSPEALAADATTQFGLQFINNLPGDANAENVVLSPLSLQNLLNMLLLGSGDNSTTHQELMKVLGYDKTALLASDRLKPHEAMRDVFKSILDATHLSVTPSNADQTLLNTNPSSLSEKQSDASTGTGKQTEAKEVTSPKKGVIEAHLQTSLREDPLSGQLNFTLANLVLSNKDLIELKPDYERDLKSYYNVNVEQFSRNSSSTGAKPRGLLHERVNNWVKAKTQGQIPKLAEKEDLDNENLIMVLLNAAHFKGRWLHTFNSKATHERTFYNRGSESEANKAVKFMRQKAVFGYADFSTNQPDYPSNQGENSDSRTRASEDTETLLTEDASGKMASDEASNQQAPTIELSKEESRHLELTAKLNCSVLMLPFSLNDGAELSMVILLPAERDGVLKLQRALDQSILNEIYKSLSETQVQVELPKFSFEGSHDAKANLIKMGLKSIFQDGANLDRMYSLTKEAGGRAGYVDKVIHKAKISVDESGAEAAAASMASIVLRNFIRPPTPYFLADHPFLFIIRHNRSNMPLFMGRVSSL